MHKFHDPPKSLLWSADILELAFSANYIKLQSIKLTAVTATSNAVFQWRLSNGCMRKCVVHATSNEHWFAGRHDMDQRHPQGHRFPLWLHLRIHVHALASVCQQSLCSHAAALHLGLPVRRPHFDQIKIWCLSGLLHRVHCCAGMLPHMSIRYVTKTLRAAV